MADMEHAHGTAVVAGIDLDTLTVPQLTALRDAAEAKREEKLHGATLDVLEETRARLAALGLTLEDVLMQQQPPKVRRGGKATGKSSGKVAAKYRGPNGQEWSGRGRQPRWLTDAEANGKSRQDFLI